VNSSKCTIVFVLPRLSGGGAERVILNLLTGLYNHGYSVGIIVFEKIGPLSSLIPEGVPVYDLRSKTLKGSIFSLIKQINILSPKVVISTLGYINIALLAISWFLPKRTKIWVREANLPSISLVNNPQSKLMRVLYFLLYRKADKVVCTSKRMRDEFIFDFSVSQDVIDILPNPVNVDAIRVSRKAIKRFDKGGVCYIASGRMTFQKGFDRLLYWFKKLNDKKSTLVILGDGSLKEELIKITISLDLQNQVKFLGFCDNPWQWYAGADVFLLSSRWEGMPNSVLEALACGTRVIATKESGGIKEIYENGNIDSITVVDNGQQFIDSMKKVNIKEKLIESTSLLPNKYREKNVISMFEIWLEAIKIPRP
jgi:glycosyltransferase involved in cell wall biosynthesis